MNRSKAISLLLCTLLLSCGPAYNALRRGVCPGLNQITSAEELELRPDSLRHEIRVEHRGESFILAAADTLQGENVASVDIPSIEIKSVFRSVPERDGKVRIAFRVEIPARILGSSSQIELTPVLHRGQERINLDNISLRGENFSLLSSRENFQHGLYLKRFAHGEEDSLRSAGRFLRSGFAFGSRLDSVLEKRERLSFLFTEEVKVRGDERSLGLTVGSVLRTLGRDSVSIPAKDTLRYSISSMTWFMDPSVRYKEIIVSRYVNLERSYGIVFPVGRSDVVDTMASNAEQIGRLRTFLRQVQSASQEFILDSVLISAYSSPEGPEPMNRRLSELRSASLCACICSEDDDLILAALRPRARGEDWDRLVEKIHETLPESESGRILGIVSRIADPDRREAEIRRQFPAQYRMLRQKVYPSLRRVSCSVHLRRKGMEKDTVRTSVVDTAYMDAVELLRQRKYARSLLTLAPYRDINAAVAHLSMGHDSEARQILLSLPSSDRTEYLLAVACSRLGLRGEGTAHLEKAVGLNPRLKYRIGLDPELSGLVDVKDKH